MTDRRRINGPHGGTAPPVYQSFVDGVDSTERPSRSRRANQLRKLFLKTGLTPSASGSAYLELEPTISSRKSSLIPARSSLKLTCTVHGPRPLPRSAPFSAQLMLTTHVKFAPCANRQRRGYIRDMGERDLGVHLDTALRGVIIGDRWPKSGAEIVVTVLEAEDDAWWADEMGVSKSKSSAGVGGWGMLTVLAGCITAASAALTEAGIDCVDLVSGGVAALVRSVSAPTTVSGEKDVHKREECLELVLDPAPSEHAEILAACVVGYLGSRDEITEIWMKGDVGVTNDTLMNGAIEAALAARAVLTEAVEESLEIAEMAAQGLKSEKSSMDKEMSG